VSDDVKLVSPEARMAPKLAQKGGGLLFGGANVSNLICDINDRRVVNSREELFHRQMR
jgi:hypothetical protein